MLYVKKEEEEVHLPTSSLEVNRGFERNDLTTLNKCWAKQVAGKEKEKTGNDQVLPVFCFQSTGSLQVKRVTGTLRIELVRESSRSWRCVQHLLAPPGVICLDLAW